MSEKEKEKETTPETQPEKKKGGGHFWMIFGAALVLLIVYQSGRGRSAGNRSAVESNVTGSNISHPIPQGIQPAQPEKIMTARERARIQRMQAEPVREQESVGEAVPLTHPAVMELQNSRKGHSPVSVARPATAPARMIETGPVLAPAIPSFSPGTGIPPHPSVYDRPVSFVPAKSTGPAQPSELGLMPLAPLTSLAPLDEVPAAAQSMAIPSTYRQPVPISSPQNAPATVIRTVVDKSCDCGKKH